ncbi:dTMP kinase [Desulfopila sp. IMCC35008]|uniref:dTMP kinase n=1 Tax=Desulfopila sp. IMCC35008 TaxID=2653858 RepID=UPI00197AE1F2|nr:dTMP kinase [Desulfopila sp. IMCC35008]
MNIKRTGRLIVFEGIDGTGKSTQLPLLAQYLESKGFMVTVTREPTDGAIGQKIRALYSSRENTTPEEELQLFLDDRKEHIEQVVGPALASGKVVLCDRYYLSTAAYQGANGFDPLEIIKRNNFAPKPDIALIFEQPIETSLERITTSRGEALNDFEQADSLKKVSAIFDMLDFPCIRRIQANDTIENIHRKVIEAVADSLEGLPVNS